MAKNILEVSSLCKSYGPVNAVDDVSFNMHDGEFLTLLGPSGSGKTTTLQMISGLTTPTSGSIDLAGKPLIPLPPHKRDIGVVFQNYALFPHMSVFKNVAFPLDARGTPSAEIKRRVGEVLETVGLPHVEDRYPAQLSGGQQQRVALARAMVFRPKLLLMDEPLGALDKKLREQIQLEIVRLHRDLGISIIYVTHDQEEALIMSDRVAVFDSGKIAQLSTPEDIYENPKSLFIADFIGDSNRLPVSVLGRDGNAFLVDGGAKMRGRASTDLPDGKGAMMIVRPERITMSSDDGTTIANRNVVAGKVKSVIYLGKSRKYVVTTNAGYEIVVLQQCVEGQADTSFGEGAEVLTHWSEKESILFAETA
jgi:putative spermidine/putrescine transport system ATP-binding protein